MIAECLCCDALRRPGHVRHEKSSFISDSTADRAHAIYLPRRSWTWPDLRDLLLSKTKVLRAPKPRLERSRVSEALDFLTHQIKRISCARFSFHFSFARSSRCCAACSIQGVFQFDFSEEGRCANMWYIETPTSAKVLAGTGISTNRKSPCCTKSRETDDYPGPFRYREVWKGCEERGLVSLPRTLVTSATFDIISSSTQSRTEDSPDNRKKILDFISSRFDRGSRVDWW